MVSLWRKGHFEHHYTAGIGRIIGLASSRHAAALLAAGADKTAADLRQVAWERLFVDIGFPREDVEVYFQPSDVHTTERGIR